MIIHFLFFGVPCLPDTGKGDIRCGTTPHNNPHYTHSIILYGKSGVISSIKRTAESERTPQHVVMRSSMEKAAAAVGCGGRKEPLVDDADADDVGKIFDVVNDALVHALTQIHDGVGIIALGFVGQVFHVDAVTGQ